MVRYHEIINEDIVLPQNQDELEALFAKYYRDGNAQLGSHRDKVFDIALIGKNTVNVHITVDGASCSLNSDNKLSKIPFRIYRCVGMYRCSDNDLTTLENVPTIVNNGSFNCANNPNLISLKYCPTTVEGYFVARGNYGLKSLEGIEMDSKITGPLFVDYSDSLPMLRTLVVKRGVKFLGASADEKAKAFEAIIKQYAGNDNLKKSLIECQYELIKAGYKGNAKW
jgi:hypothetical protein